MTASNPDSPLPCTLVTGASSGIGRALALALAAEGTEVIALGRDAARLQALAAAQPGIDPIVADLAALGSIAALAERIVARHPGLAIVINNAAVQHDLRFDDPHNDAALIQQELAIDLAAPMLLVHALLAQLARQPAAAIVNVTSGLAYVPKRTAAVYSASKAGLRLFTDALRVQLRGGPVRVVEAVMPLVDTPMTAGRGNGKLAPEEAARQLVVGLRAGRDVVRVGKTRALPLLLRVAPRLLARMLQRVEPTPQQLR